MNENERIKNKLIDENKELQLQLKLENQYMKNKLRKENEDLIQKLQQENSDLKRKIHSPKRNGSEFDSNKKNPILRQVFSYIGHTEPIKSIVISKDETIMLTGDDKGHLIQWDLINKYPHHYGEFHSDIIWSIKISTCGQYAYTFSGDCTICKFNIANKSFERKYSKIHESPITCCEVLLDDQYFVTGEANGEIKILKFDYNMDFVVVKEFDKLHKSFVSSITATSNGYTIVTASSDSTLIVWNNVLAQVACDDIPAILAGSIVEDAHKGTIWNCTFGKNDKFLYSTGSDMNLKQWSLKYLQLELKTSLTGQHAGELYCIAINEDGTKAFTAGVDKKIAIWNIDGTMTNTNLVGTDHKRRIWCIACGTDYLYTASYDKKIVQWKLNSTHEPAQQESLDFVS